jgi:hypothetical protein
MTGGVKIKMSKKKTRKLIILHVGKRIPKGFKELPGSVHLGKGIWLFKIEKEVNA